MVHLLFICVQQTHYGPKETRDLKTAELLTTLSACIECQNPTTDLYKFVGTLKLLAGEPSQVVSRVSLGSENVLLRGARLKDTEFIFGCAVYTGRDTKMALNSKLTRNKFSTVERYCYDALKAPSGQRRLAVI